MKSLTLIALAALVAAGCHGHEHDESGGHEHDESGGHGESAHGHGHGHGDGVAIGITRWTPKLELFAEHPPAVVGQQVPFLAHLTVLDGFRALEDAQVLLELDGPEPIRARVDEMLRPGIFQPTFVPRAPGDYRGRLVVTGPEVQDTIEGLEMRVHASAAEAAEANPAEEEEDGGTISFLKEQQWKVPFATAFADERNLVPTVEVAGQVDTPPGGSAEIGAAVAGQLIAPRQGLPRPGQTVDKGQLLATIAPAPSSPEDAARARLAVTEAQARQAAARTALERAERLIRDQAIAARELEGARRELEVANQAVQSARQAAALFSGAASGRGAGSWRLTCPIDGVLTEVRASPGQAVSPGDVLFEVVDASELWIRARVPEQDASRLRADRDASFQLAGLDTWLPLDVTGDDATARLVTIGRTVARESRTVEVIYSLDKPDPRLRFGGLVRVALPAGDDAEGVAVPRSAVVDDGGRDIVYVQVEGEAFEERAVRVGPRAGAFVAISSGVKAGERVVTLGANLLRLAARAPAEAGHGHVH